MPAKLKDLSNMRFGRLVVTSEHIKGKDGQTLWKCICDCGNETYKRSAVLSRGDAHSCGCIKKEIAINKAANSRYKTKLYRRWVIIHRRCSKNDLAHKKNYYDKNIKVCQEWCGIDGFDSFKEWALSNGYDDKLTIDRIDVTKGYSPQNCRWVDMTEQQNNKRNNVVIEMRGERKTVAQWERVLGFTEGTLRDRLRRGWSLDRAFDQPMRAYRR